jgi:hypothetical protein
MFVRRSPSGEIIAAGSINHAKLAELQAGAKKPRKAAPKPAAESPAPQEATGQVESAFKSALDAKEG